MVQQSKPSKLNKTIWKKMTFPTLQPNFLGVVYKLSNFGGILWIHSPTQDALGIPY